METRSPINILYMEDDSGIARLFKKRMERKGYIIDHACDGIEGLSKYENHNYDVLVIDYKMPGCDGLEVIKKLSENDNPPPMIMVTGLSDVKIAVEALKMGAGDYIVKDIELDFIELLPAVIEQLLQSRRMAEEKRQAEKKLFEMSRELNDFSYKICRDLKSSLNKINGYLVIIKNDPSMFDKLFYRTLRQSQYLITHLDKLLNLASASRVTNDRSDIDFNSLVKRAYLTVKDEKIPINISVDSSLDVIKGDQSKLEQVFVNIIKNSMTFRDPNKDRVDIEISCKKNCSYAIIKIKDNGKGIKKEDLDRVFNLNYTSIKEEGTGIGLAITRKIIEAHGGIISIDSPGEKQGIIVSIKIPL